MTLAKATNTPVLFTTADVPLEVTEPIRTADAPVVTVMRTAPIMAIKPTGEEVQLAEVVTPPPAQTEVAMAPMAPMAAEKTLPATASQLPLMGLIGLLALGGFLALRVAEKRVQ
jgi:hypothetical protein